MDPAPAPEPAPVLKKRKRTGKEREERKKAAIQAQLAQEQEHEQEHIQEHEQATDPPIDTPAQEPPEQNDPTVKPGAGEGLALEAGSRVVVDLEQLAKRLPVAIKRLHPLFKHAKLLETRRLIKKIKFLRTKADSKAEVSDLEAQLQLLSHLDINPILASHLLLKLRKHHSLKHQSLPEEVVTQLAPTANAGSASSGSSANAVLMGRVENRLCSSKEVAEGVKATVGWLVGEEGAKLAVPASKKKVIAQQGAHGQAEGKDRGTKRNRDDSAAKPGLEPRDDDEGEGEDGDSDDAEQLTNNLAQYDEEADAAGWESGSISGGDNDGDRDLGDSDSDDDSDDDAIAISIPNAKRSRQQMAPATASVKANEKAARNAPVTSSLFLPSLSTGFTRGDDDASDPDDDYGDGLDGVIGKKGVERKNRRGQRARQAIWEKKYGKNANHVKRSQEQDAKLAEKNNIANAYGKRAGTGTSTSTVAGDTTSSRVAPAQTRGGKAGSYHPRPPSASTTPAAAHIPTPPSFGAQSSQSQSEGKKSLHPSWEAAKLRRQKEMGAAPKATKIVFD